LTNGDAAVRVGTGFKVGQIFIVLLVLQAHCLSVKKDDLDRFFP